MAEPAAAGDPPRRDKKRRVGLGALTTTAIAVVGVVIAYGQLHLADVQTKVGNQESLVSLVTDIAQQTRSLATAPGAQQAAIEQARLADAAQGFALVNALHDQVPAIDDYELGQAFQGEFEYRDALISFDRAAAGGDPHYRASSERGAAGILYALGGPVNDRQAERDIQGAYDTYSDQQDVTRAERDNNYALTDAFDAWEGGLVNCKRAHREIAAAKHLIAADPAAGDYVISADLRNAERTTRICY
jgi:hypothetical protein